MPATEVRAVAVEQQDLFVCQDEGRVLPGFPFEAHQALVAGLQVMAQPDTAHARGRDLDAGQTQVVGDALGAVGGPGQAMGEHPFLDLRGDAVRVRAARAAALFDQGSDTAGNPPIFSIRQKWRQLASINFCMGVIPPSAMFGRS